MNNQEAKFILGAYRPDGQDASDATFAAALAQAAQDPELRTWLERQRKFDATLTHKLREIAPPAGLREAILAGTRVSASVPARRWWTHPAWLAAAAAVIVFGAIFATRKPPTPRPAVSDFVSFALRDLAEAHASHIGYPPALSGVQAQFAGARLPMTGTFSVDLDELRRKGCRSVRMGGREVFELCLQRDNRWYHVYVARRDDFTPGGDDSWRLLTAQGDLASTGWSDGKNVYAIVVGGSRETLRPLI